MKTNTEIFVEVKISSFKFVDLGYPDVVVDFVPGFNFKPSSKYALVAINPRWNALFVQIVFAPSGDEDTYNHKILNVCSVLDKY